MNFAPILSAFKASWTAQNLLPEERIYFDRASQPDKYDGFPYLELDLVEASNEVSTMQGNGTNLVTYLLSVTTYNVQGQTGGDTTGDPVTDCYNLQVAVNAVLANIPPNLPWDSIAGFLHCIPTGGGTVVKDELLFDGRDVYVSTDNWRLLIGE